MSSMKQPGRNTSSDVKASTPFIVYRERLDSYAKAMRNGWSDKQFVDLVNRLDQEICGIDGTGFSTTPVIDGTALAVALGLNVDLKVKVEINNIVEKKIITKNTLNSSLKKKGKLLFALFLFCTLFIVKCTFILIT